MKWLYVAPIVLGLVSAESSASALEGTWSTKSNAVFTGPDFYDPVDELLIEPALPGMSYSFTSDGYFEEAIYQVTANPKDPGCPTGVMIFQHGKYEIMSNGSLVLNPFIVDGRQLLSEPCQSSTSTYTRYNQTEFFKSFNVYVDDYHGRYRLDLFQHDGSPMPPFYLSYKPPQMLPTQTLNPTSGGTQETGTSKTIKRIRRSLENRGRTNAVRRGDYDYNVIWWFGVSLMCVGATGWYFL
uniref:Protein ROT1 n=1 Tax=Blastobotrys adeninivorans TaxID=409370 RepID=A0A060T5E9_BLAAD